MIYHEIERHPIVKRCFGCSRMLPAHDHSSQWGWRWCGSRLCWLRILRDVLRGRT